MTLKWYRFKGEADDHEKPHIKIKELSVALSGTTPEELDAKAGSTDGRMRTKNIAKFIVDLYNGRTPDAQDPHRV